MHEKQDSGIKSDVDSVGEEWIRLDWQALFEAHVRFLGERWVSAPDEGQTAYGKEERAAILRKHRLLQDKGARIEKTTVRAKVTHLDKQRLDQAIDYRLHTQWLIRNGDAFHVEERIEDRRALIQDSTVISDGIRTDTDEDQPSIPVPGSSVREEDAAVRGHYDRLKAVRYAELWWDRRNPAFPNVVNDCTNFVSQCLFAGGIPMIGQPVRSRGWWQSRTNWSFTWTVANSLRWYMSGSGNVFGTIEAERADKLIPGDVICYDFNGDGRWDHNSIVTAIDASGEPLVNAHTYDARRRDWSYRDSPAWTKQIQYKFFHIPDKVGG